jgi:predicted transcriptional regulator
MFGFCSLWITSTYLESHSMTKEEMDLRPGAIYSNRRYPDSIMFAYIGLSKSGRTRWRALNRYASDNFIYEFDGYEKAWAWAKDYQMTVPFD